MKIKDVMTPAPRTCARSTNLAAAAEIMLQGDCGILPVVDEGRLAGVVTDRDLFIALGTRDQRPSALTIGDVMQSHVTTCDPDDDVEAVLQVMKDRRIRRVPVAGFGGSVIGIVSMNDLVLVSGAKKGVRDSAIVDTLRGICSHHHPSPQIAAA